MKNNILGWLQSWYLNQCDGDWEHGYGIKIGTLDNPGWKVDINLIETVFEDCSFEKIEIERSDNDWVHCKIENKHFKGYGGPNNLTEILNVFRSWIESIESKN